MTVALAMIVLNEPIDRIAILVEHLKPTVTQFVIGDTGSVSFEQDRPFYESWGVDYFQHEWKNDFSEARNAALARVAQDADWVVQLDGDEIGSRLFLERLTRLDETPSSVLGYLVYTKNFWGGEAGVEQPNDWNWHCRIFRRHAGRYYKVVHEQVLLNGLDEATTRNNGLLPKLDRSEYIIHSKPQERIISSHHLYSALGEGGIIFGHE